MPTKNIPTKRKTFLVINFYNVNLSEVKNLKKIPSSKAVDHIYTSQKKRSTT